MKKLIRDGKVGVIYSPEYGAGWYTWNTNTPELLFDENIIRHIEAEDIEGFNEYIKREYSIIASYYRLQDLSVQWLPIGTEFKINEYDGLESIELKNEINWFIA